MYRDKSTNVPLGTGGISVLNKITGSKPLFLLVLSAGVALGIAGFAQTSATDFQKGAIFCKVSIIIFLVLTVVLLYRCFIFYRHERLGAWKSVRLISYIPVLTACNHSKPRI
jgi:hypothetical protein